VKTLEQHEEMRTRLLDSTTKAVSKYGLSNLTTRSISAINNINEAYIYRYFLDKDDLVYKAFVRSENIIFEKFSDFFKKDIMTNGKDFKEKLKAFFIDSIEYLIKDEINATMVIRYVYSIYFKGKALQGHRESSEELVKALSLYIKDDADVVFIGHNMLMTILSYTSEILNGSLPNDRKTLEKIFEFSFRCYEPDIDWNKVKKL